MVPIRLLALTAVGSAVTAYAQPRLDSPVVSRLQGSAYVKDTPITEPGASIDGAVLRTAAASRAEIRIRGGVLYVGENSSVRVSDNRPYNFNQLQILAGSAVLVTGKGSGVLVMCEDAVKVSDDGVFRFDLSGLPQSRYGENECRFRVYKGAASVQLVTTPVVLTSGKAMQLNRRCGDMIPTQDFNTEESDDLDRWSRGALLQQR